MTAKSRPSGGKPRSRPAKGRSGGAANRQAGAPSKGPAKSRAGGKGRPKQSAGPRQSAGRKQARKGPPRRGAPRRKGQRGSTPLRSDDADRRKTLGGEQVEGRHAVRELLMAGTRRTREVVFAADLDPAPILDDIIDLADELKVPMREISRSRFESMTRTDGAQGVVASAAPLRPVDLAELLEPDTDGTAPFLLLLDSVTDPRNLGAILRTAECAGVSGVVLPRHRAARITPTVAKASAGAVEHLRMAVVGGLAAAMKTISAKGIWTVGLDSTGDRSVFDLAMAAEPLALVLGAEGAGLSRLVRERCDTVAAIPLNGVIASLNVANAAAVACFEIARQRSRPLR